MIKVAYASISEKGTIQGKRGDQSGYEVKIGLHYNFGQHILVRFKSVANRKMAVKIAKMLVKNEKIGYSQSDRYSLYHQLESIGWDFSRLDEIKKCNTDCSMMIICIINLVFKRALITDGYTGNMARILEQFPNRFDVIKNFTFKTERSYYRLGDIEIRPYHHAVMIIDR